MNHSITLDFKDDELTNFKKIYEHFLTFEHITSQKAVWREQKKVYEEILNALEPKIAFEKFRLLNKTTHQIASDRLMGIR